MYKNIDNKTILELKKQVEYQEISTHVSGGDAMVTVLEGKGEFVISGKEYFLESGQTIIIPKDEPHSVYGKRNLRCCL
mgnify:CR=1 FL=1